MDTQQIITLIIVVAAVVYLGRQLVVSARSFFRAKSGCSSGCGKCGYAREGAQQTVGKFSPGINNIIPLASIRTGTADQPTAPAKKGIH